MRFKRISVVAGPLEQVFVALILYVLTVFYFKQEKNSKPI
ncbi:hypothetical protein STRDD04_00415 [Streptococcus sp. DD04]|nr:hypothetical protein STRDD04_00415 [Streptococcus sp. DD04]